GARACRGARRGRGGVRVAAGRPVRARERRRRQDRGPRRRPGGRGQRQPRGAGRDAGAAGPGGGGTGLLLGGAQAGGRAAALVVEASGTPEALAGTLGLLAREGTVLVCSWYGTRPVALPLGAAFHRRRLALRSTQVSPLPAALTARWDRARRTELAWRLVRELPLSDLGTPALACAE